MLTVQFCYFNTHINNVMLKIEDSVFELNDCLSNECIMHVVIDVRYNCDKCFNKMFIFCW